MTFGYAQCLHLEMKNERLVQDGAGCPVKDEMDNWNPELEQFF